MTIEKAKLVLDSLTTWVGQERLITDEIVEAIKMLSQPSLPSNLDEVAEELYPNPDVKRGTSVFANDEWREVKKLKDAFKAGAEWMTGQGYTREGVARPDDDEIWVNLKNTDIKDGDKVVVQIRKK